MLQDSMVPPVLKTRARALTPLEQVVLVSKPRPRLQSQVGSRSCRPKSPATRIRNPMPSSALIFSRIRFNGRPCCVQFQHDLQELLTADQYHGLVWHCLKRVREARCHLQEDQWPGPRLGMMERLPCMDRTSRSDPTCGRRQRLIRRIRRQWSTKTLLCNRCLPFHSLLEPMAEHRL